MVTRIDSPETRAISDTENPESKTLRAIERRKDGSTLNAFWKMLDNFMLESGVAPDKVKWAESLKKSYISQASWILNDASLNEAWKNEALQKLFGSFKENKEFFPTPTEQLQSSESAQMKYEKSKDDFYEKFLKVLAEQDSESMKVGQSKSKKLWIAGDQYTWDRYPPYWDIVTSKVEGDLKLV